MQEIGKDTSFFLQGNLKQGKPIRMEKAHYAQAITGTKRMTS